MSAKFTWLGHATFWVELDSHRILIDPFLTDNPANPGVKAGDLTPDFILITHGHFDHISDAVSIAARSGAKVISTLEVIHWLNGQGITNTHAQQHGGGFRHEFGHLKLTIAHHGSMLPDGAYGGNPAGLLITTTAGKKVYFAGDTGLFLDMQLYGEEGLDLAFLPIGDNFTMGPGDAFRAVKLLKAKTVIPCHYDTWPPISVDAAAWVSRVNAETSSKAVLIKPGESYTLE